MKEKLRMRIDKKIIISGIAILSLLSLLSLQLQPDEEVDFVDYIDPTIGNVAPFLVPTYPTTHLPNQMLRTFPVRKDYLSDEIKAFPLHVYMHRNTGLFHLKVAANNKASLRNQSMIIDHDLEKYQPWHFTTFLIEDNIRVSFTPSDKSGIYKIEFPKGEKELMVKGKGKMDVEVMNANTFVLTETIYNEERGVGADTLSMEVYAYMELVDEDAQPVKLKQSSNNTSMLSLTSTTDAPETVYVKYAVSYVSKEQARDNFKRELKGKTFDIVRSQAKKAWQKAINQVKVEGGTTAQKRTFYTSLYRTYERMVDINEYGKYYNIYDGKVYSSNRPYYVDDWVWDTYRATHPLRTILNPEQQGDMVQSYVQMYQHSGWMPTFPQVFGNHMCMNSYHTSSIILDALNKGITNFDHQLAYEGIQKNLTEGTFLPWRQGHKKGYIDDFFLKEGYYPALKLGEKDTIKNVDNFEKRQPVAVTLGISFDFWALGGIAEYLGDVKNSKEYYAYSKNYKNLWNDKLQLFMPKDSEGNWINIDPKNGGGLGYRNYFDENNAWTYAWDVQQDISGLIQLLGGKEKAEQRLDQLFREPLGMRKAAFYVNGANSTGMVGQFSMGNEPSFHIPYLYNHFGVPWKTQKRTRFLLDTWFKDNIFGIPGDEDGGGMTAFVVMTSLGIYPVTPGLPYYDITSPIFEKSSIELKNGRIFEIHAKGSSKEKKYIQQAFLNGEEINEPFIKHDDIMKGGKLELIMGELPNKEWGTDGSRTLTLH
ncbi:GH92 family glycosyl hydrolase [Flammeovirga agarivorans]|uniref:Glycoside hydrolase family 92 protein n=1 Tax=Flammeovirga agarivorans TaxID=2726742 RepID=A0A7X8XYR6_9BACT|nr:GH92 family glycosyl hydrolase [Flammeovirga agarivorans]NLR94383.1 glycoside hydrolase family 92 protein [Flammeovirga agarivorans]